MVIPTATFDFLKQKYETVSEAFITEVNRTPMILFYNIGNLNNVSVFADEPSIMDQYGGRTDIYNLADREYESGQNKIVAETSGTILTRAYWNPKQDKIDLKVEDLTSVCKIITYSEYDSQLRSAVHATVNDKQVKRIFGPIPYGLFGEKQYCCSYWQIF